MHLDIKPSNFLVTETGLIKIGDFGLSRKMNEDNDEIYEGDSVYLAPEILKLSKFKELDKAIDVFSLGLSILEIISKIELPQSGQMWKEIRTEGFKIKEENLRNSNIKHLNKDFISLIEDMITYEPKKRKSLNYFLDNYKELKLRNFKLNNRDYKRSIDPDSVFPQEEINPFKYAKRSDSYKSGLF